MVTCYGERIESDEFCYCRGQVSFDKGYELMYSDNWIHVVEAFKPAKADALAYLSDESKKVDKYAHVS